MGANNPRQWRSSPTSRNRDGHVALVQGGRAIGSCPPGLRGRPDGHLSRRMLLHDRHQSDAETDHPSLHRRWAIEVMFEETCEHVGLETMRGRCAKATLRAEPCLFGLYTSIALCFSELPEQERREPVVEWTGSVKQTLTFSDAITLVRRNIWRCWVWESPRHATAFQKLTP